MNTNSNSYTIIYASVMVIIVAFLLAFVSSSLKETQNKNVELDTKKQILSALNSNDVEDAEAAYNTYVKGDMLMQADGSLVANDSAFNTNYKGRLINHDGSQLGIMQTSAALDLAYEAGFAIVKSTRGNLNQGIAPRSN